MRCRSHRYERVYEEGINLTVAKSTRKKRPRQEEGEGATDTRKKARVLDIDGDCGGVISQNDEKMKMQVNYSERAKKKQK
jgi:hypothetical protein